MQILKQLAVQDLESNILNFWIFELYTHVHSLDLLGLLIQAILVKKGHPTGHGLCIELSPSNLQ